jgi:hypothetical protein
MVQVPCCVCWDVSTSRFVQGFLYFLHVHTLEVCTVMKGINSFVAVRCGYSYILWSFCGFFSYTYLLERASEARLLLGDVSAAP